MLSLEAGGGDGAAYQHMIAQALGIDPRRRRRGWRLPPGGLGAQRLVVGHPSMPGIAAPAGRGRRRGGVRQNLKDLLLARRLWGNCTTLGLDRDFVPA